VLDRGEQSLNVEVVKAGDGVAEVGRDACSQAGGQSEDVLFPSGAGKPAAVQRCDGGVPVDGCHHGAVRIRSVVDEPAGEIGTVQERGVADDQANSGFVG
jgi:hypothetical protein